MTRAIYLGCGCGHLHGPSATQPFGMHPAEFDRQVALMAVDLMLADTDERYMQRVAQREDPAVTDDMMTDAEYSKERGTDLFLKEETKIALALSTAIAARGEPIIDKIMGQIEDTNELRAPLANVISDAQKEMATVFDEASDEVTKAVTNTLVRGAKEVEQYPKILDIPTVQKVRDGIVRATAYYTNRFFNTFVVPAIQDEIDKIFDETNPTDVPDMSSIRDVLDSRLKSVPYWRVVANAAASRGFHYGMVKAGRLKGATQYEIVAVLDDKTSKVCEFLDGKRFWLADAISLLEKAELSNDPDAVRRIMPWPQLSTISNLDAAGLRDAGCIIPPFHGNCRTTIKLVWD